MRQTLQRLTIEGKLLENTLQETSYVKNGKTVEAIRGQLVVKTHETINGQLVDIEVPLQYFANKYTSKGALSKAYTAVETAMNEFRSAASQGSIEEADIVRIQPQISERFYSPDGQKPREFIELGSGFIHKGNAATYAEQAKFELEMVVLSMTEEIGTNEEPTGRLIINAGIGDFFGNLHKIKVIAPTKSLTDAVMDTWSVGQTVTCRGVINFSTSTEKKVVESAFGEDSVHTYTRTTKEFILTGGGVPLDDEKAVPMSEIEEAAAQRQVRIDEEEAKGKARGKTTTAASTNTTNAATSAAMDKLGF